MKIKAIIISLLLSGAIAGCADQEKTSGFSIKLSVAEEIQPGFKSKGRLFVFLNQNPDVEPRTYTWPNPGNFIFAKNISV